MDAHESSRALTDILSGMIQDGGLRTPATTVDGTGPPRFNAGNASRRSIVLGQGKSVESVIDRDASASRARSLFGSLQGRAAGIPQTKVAAQSSEDAAKNGPRMGFAFNRDGILSARLPFDV